MNHCPSENELQGLLADRLPDEVRASVEGHIEACTKCQRHLDTLTQAVDLKLSTSHSNAGEGPAFLKHFQAHYPATLLNGAGATAGTLHFPGPPTEGAPLGQVGDFDILAELGRGSFGWVFRAHERSLDRIVALKVLKPEMTARPDAILRFEREARKASLKHDHIVSVYRFEKPTGFPPYLVMEFVEGETLEAKLKQDGKLPPKEAAAIARQVALGLAAAHAHGMVHRDIKPANILLEYEDEGGRMKDEKRKNSSSSSFILHPSFLRVKISDFGLARDITDESMAVTGAGELAGTAPYMSPEHFRSPEKVDGRSDVFSLGIVLYQLLTGQLPFKGSFLQIRSGILDDEPKSPRRLNDSVPVDLETITLACLEKAPACRYATAGAVAEDLRRYQNGEPILCRPTGKVERTLKWVRRKPAQALLAGVGMVAAVAIVVLVVGQVFYAQLQAANKQLEDKTGELKGKNDELREQRQRVERLNYVADMNLAHQAFQNDNFELLEQYLAGYQTSELRGFEWHYLRWLANTEGRRIGPKGQRVTAFAFDREGLALALGVWDGNVAQVQLWTSPSAGKLGGELLSQSVEQTKELSDVVFHPTKDLLITSDRQGTIVVWNAKSLEKTRTLTGNGPLALSPDGETLAYLRPDGAVQRWSFLLGREIGEPLFFDLTTDVAGANKDKGRGFKPGETDKSKPRIPTSVGSDKSGPRDKGDGSDKGIRVKGDSADKGKRVKEGVPSGLDSPILQLAFSHDSKRLAAVGGLYASAGSLCVWNVKDGSRLALVGAQTKDMLVSVAFSPDGQAIAAAGYDHALHVWDAKTGALRFHRIAHKLEVLSVAFNATGDLLATAGWDKSVKIWSARTGEELRSLRGNRGVVEQVTFSPDAKAPGGEHLASLNQAGELRWWDAETEQTARVTRHAEPLNALAFSPKGRFLATFGRDSKVLIQNLAEPNESVVIALGMPGSRGMFTSDEKALLALGSGGLQMWPFAKNADAIDVPKVAHATSQRFVVPMDGRWLLSQPYPSATEPLQNLVPFGAAVEPAPRRLAIDAPGNTLAYVLPAGGIVVRRRDHDTGDVTETTLKTPVRPISALACSPDGSLLAVSNPDFTISLLDAKTGTLLCDLRGHLCIVGCLTFSPDGKRLVSGSEDWTVKIWDIEAGRATLTLTGHKGRIRDVAFSPDGTLLASASEDATVRVWPTK